jgi:hypothetical protein
MGRELEEARLFSENIDRLLAGEEVRIEGEMDDDRRTALDFARRMTALRTAPAPSFQAHLKTRLLQKMNEHTSEARQGWFWRLVPREPVWQAVAVLAIMIVVGGLVWGTLFQAPPAQPPVAVAPATSAPPASTTSAAPASSAPATSMAPTTTAAAPASGNLYLNAEASVDKPSYISGEAVNIHMTWQNISPLRLTVEQFPPILSLMQASNGQPVYTFAAGRNTLTLNPGEKTDYILTWNQLDARGRHVAPGGYYLELEQMYFQGQTVRMNLARPVNFEILPASTRTIRTLNPGQSQTVNDITVTLQRLDITDSGVTVSAFVSPPPDYTLQPGTPAISPTQGYPASAVYSIDGSWVKDIGLSSVEYFGHGMEHTWYIPEPLPEGASEMTFIVNSLGNRTGPWQFNVDLK